MKADIRRTAQVVCRRAWIDDFTIKREDEMTRIPGRPAVVAITALLLLVAGGLHVALAGDLPVETIEIGGQSGFRENCKFSGLDGEAELVITNRTAWERFWARHDPRRSLPR